MATVSSTWTGERLGWAFPGAPVVISGARETRGIIDEVDDALRSVVATSGAEPVAEGRYRVVLFLDGAALSSRPDLDAIKEALRQRSNAVVLAAPSVRVVLLGGPEPVAAQVLVRWDRAGLAHRDPLERAGLYLPPVRRVARLDGPVRTMGFLLAQVEAGGFEALGLMASPSVHGQVLPGVARALIHAPSSRGKALAIMLGV